MTRCWRSRPVAEFMSDAPLITTILPTYRRPLLLKRAVLSVLNQSYPHFVVRILDNASGDDTEQMARDLARMDPRVQYHRHSENIGSLNNMIYGMEGVTTPYFNILCDDDFLLPDFFAEAVRIHEASASPMAFVSTRVVVVDEKGSFMAPGGSSDGHLRLVPPDGLRMCLAVGASLTGIVYRTSAIAAIGAPRTAWWNWTESGWHGLAALDHPIEFSPALGAVVFNHAGSNSKKMDRIEFRVSWFEMLAELHDAALRRGVSPDWWTKQVLPLAYQRLRGTVVRLCGHEGPEMYDRLARLGAVSGMNASRVAATIRMGRVARALGVGGLVNDTSDLLLRVGRLVRSSAGRVWRREDPDLFAVSRVFADLNCRAGLE